MKILIILLLVVPLLQPCIAQQNVAINSTAALPHASAQLDISSNNKGLLIPRMNSMQRVGISSPATGLLVFDTTTNSFWYYSGTSWINLAASANNWLLGGNSGTSPLINYIGTNDNADLRFRINTFNAGLLSNNGNVFFGWRSNNSNSTSFPNTAIGSDALFSNTTGNFNAALGNNALRSNTTGYDNTAIGSNSLLQNNIGFENTALGKEAMLSNTSGYTNTATGIIALYSNTTGSNNTANGGGALTYNTTGYSNVAIGAFALQNNTTRSNLVAVGDSALLNNNGNWNVAIGSKALYTNTGGNYNTATGYRALFSNTLGHWNTAHGLDALTSNTTGWENTAVAVDALRFNTIGISNTAIGYQSLYSNVSGSFNTAFGNRSIFSNSSGNQLVAVGDSVLFSNTSGSENTAVGSQSLRKNISGSKNSSVGYQALYSNDGSSNSAFGYRSLFNNSVGLSNTALGSEALFSNSSGTQNSATGLSTLFQNTTGSYNTANGASSMGSNTTGNSNTAAGARSLSSNTTGFSNVAIGRDALLMNSTRSNLVAIGDSALLNNGIGVLFDYHATFNTAIGSKSQYSNTRGWSNTSIGYRSLYSNTDGAENVAIGYRALYSNTEGGANIAIGSEALVFNTTGHSNVAINRSMALNTTGHSNTAVGWSALYNNTTGTNNTAVGYYAFQGGNNGNFNTALGYSTSLGGVSSLDNATAIGAYARVDCSNCLVLGSVNGNGGPSDVNVGIGQTNPGFPLNFRSSTGDKISLYGNSGIHYGFGIQPNLLQIHTDAQASDIAFGYGTSSTFTETMRIKGNGNAGIRVTNPTAKLSISSNGSELSGTVLSDVFRTNAGNLGNNAGDILKLGSFGFNSGNNSSLGIRAYRHTAAANWQNAAVMLSYDVDNTFNAPGGQNYLAFSGTGNIGIGTVAPLFLFEVNGVAAKPGGGLWGSTSDSRLKQSVQSYTDGLSTLTKINPVKYHYNDLSGYDTKPEYVGVIAQELQSVAPYMVKPFQKNGETFYSVDNSSMIYMLINAVKEQQQQIEELKKENTEIKNLLNKE